MPNEASAQKRPSVQPNYVHKDEIWKDHVRQEISCQLRKWPARWGFLVQEYEKLTSLLEGKPPEIRPPSQDSESKRTVIGEIKLPPIKPLDRKRKASFPVTTAQEIGWKSKEGESDVCIRWAPRARRHCGILKLLKWPAECAS